MAPPEAFFTYVSNQATVSFQACERLLLVPARAGVVVEGVLRVRVDLDLEGHPGLLQRGDQLLTPFVGEVLRVVRVDAEDGRA